MPIKPSAAERPPENNESEAGKPEAGKPEAGKPEADTPDAQPGVDVKEQFRLALERKRAGNAESHRAGGSDGAKISSTHGRAGNKREFRRKSGG